MSESLRLDRAVFAVNGPDAADFLQQLVTNDVSLLESAPVIYAGLLSPQGKVNADFLLWRDQDRILVDAPVHAVEALRGRLQLYRLRARVEIGPIEAGLGVFSGPARQALLGAADPRLPDLGLRAIAPTEGAPQVSEPGAWRARRISVGLPDLSHDAQPDEVFALEALFEELHGVAFQKGCFIGQENVSRMKRRATTRKKFCPVVFDGPPPAYGATVSAGAAELGTIRTGVEGRAIALLRLDRAQEALDNGGMLVADGKALHLAAPSWLIMPSATETA